MPVALGDTAIGAFVAAGADRRRGFGLDQLLQRPAGQLADQIDAITGLQRGEQVGQGRLDRAIGVFSFGEFFAEHTKDHADGSPAGGPRIPTTPRGSVSSCVDVPTR